MPNFFLVNGFIELFSGVGTGLLHRPYVIIRYQQQVPNNSGVGTGTFSGIQNQCVRHQIDANTKPILLMPNRCQHRTYYTYQFGANTRNSEAALKNEF